MNNSKEENRSAEILIVDDDPKSLQVLGNLIKDIGYHVEFALNGKEALNWLSKKKFDLVLLDVMMPEMDGFEVCEKIKSNPEAISIPVIFLTAQDDVESKVKAFDFGAIDYITKPFNKNELSARVTTQVKLKLMNEKLINYSNLLETKNRNILDSINYAKKIQSAIIPDIHTLQQIFPECFVLFKPKDIVSGDFYWFKIRGDKIIIAVVDCTGHGVPGAIMSMIGYTALNQAFDQHKMSQPNEILDFMHLFVMKFLNKTDDYKSLTDGMDLSVCVIDKNTNKLSFAGAHRSLIIVRNEELNAYKGNSWSVGELFIAGDKFTKTEIELEKNDTIYMYTDGYADQFSGVS